MTARAPNMREKLAATILAWQRALGTPVPREHAQAMTAHQICSLVEFDHYPVRRVDGGTNHPDNLEPLFRAEHRHKTATIDVPQIRKADRITRTEQALRAGTGMPGDPGITPEAQKVASSWVRELLGDPPRGERPKRRMQSRGFDKTKSRTFAGKVRERSLRR